MTKRLIDAAERLAEETSGSVEYSDWPELQEAIVEVRAAAEQARNIGFGVEPTLWEFAIRFLAKVNDCEPARISCNADDGVTIIAFTWKKGYMALLLVISDDGEADYAMTRQPGDQLSNAVKSFKIADEAPEEIESFIRMNFTLNQTVQ